VAIEGIDGCGKTTQAKMLVDRLKKEGHKAMYVQPIFVLLNILTRSKGNDVALISPRETRTSQMSDSDKRGKRFLSKKLFMSLLGYPYAVATYIFMKFTGRNKIIICDRYFYQFFFDLFGDWSENIIKFFPKPDITFFLDGDLDFFYSRMDDSFDAHVSKDYYSEVINLYRKIFKKYGFIQIDAKLKRVVINNIISMHLTKEIGGKYYE
jgi:thymidylate kinase